MTTDPPAAPAQEVHVLSLQADVRAEVEHHAPCVPECPVCHPEGEDE